VNRWLVVFGSICIQLCLGAVYAWSLFNQPLAKSFGWSIDDIVITFSITIATFAFFTMIAGKLQDKIGPRGVASLGGILLGTGLILSSQATSLLELYIYYGVIGGAGIGMAYVCPIATCVKWFPDKKGFISGIAVAGFGAGGLVFKPVILYLMESYGVSNTFLYLGIIYIVLVVGGAQLLKNPPNIQINKLKEQKTLQPIDFTTGDMLRTRSFYLLWFMFLMGCTSGLMVISFAVDIGVQVANLALETAAASVMMIAIFNAAGRIVLGTLSDKYGRKPILISMYICSGLIMLFMNIIPMNYPIFLLFVSFIGFNFGGFLSIFPSITAEYYGTKNIGINYGLMYQAYGVAAFVGPVIATTFGFTNAFLLAVILNIGGILLTTRLKKTQNELAISNRQLKKAVGE